MLNFVSIPIKYIMTDGLFDFFIKRMLKVTNWMLLLLLLVSGVVVEGRAQANQDDLPQFNNLQTEDGLSNLRITALCQDSLGYLWMGTPRGLNRYNGYEIVQFFHERDDSLSLRDDFINCLFLDNDQQLWIGTSTGLDLFDLTTNQFVHYTSEQALMVLAIAQDHTGQIYVGTNDGFGKVFPDEKKIARIADPHNVHAPVRTIQIDQDQQIWAGLDFGKGLARYHPQGDTLSFFVNEGVSEDQNSIYCMYQGSNKHLWLGTQKGITVFDPQQKKYLPNPQFDALYDSLAQYPVRFIYEYAPFQLWMGTEQGGIYTYDLYNDNIARFTAAGPTRLSSNMLTSILQDSKGNVWVGTFNHGLDVYLRFRKKFNPEPFLAQITRGMHVSYFLEDAANNLYIATRGQGLLYVNRATRKVKYFEEKPGSTDGLLDNRIRKLMEDSEGNIWIGLHNGLQVYHPASGEFTDLSANVKYSDVVELVELSPGEVLAGTSRYGVIRFDTELRCKGPFKIPLPAENVVQITRHSNGKIYFAAYYNTIYEYDPVEKKFRDLQKISKTNTSSLPFTITAFEDSHHDLYFGTYGRGLIHYNPRTQECQTFDVKDGLPSNDVVSILEDRNGHLWISTSFGLSEFLPEEKKFINYYASDGLVGDQFQEYAGMKDHEGNLYFGGNFGLTYFNPSAIHQNPAPPQLIVEDMKVMNKSLVADGTTLSKPIAFTNEITLNHQQSIFSIDYLAIDYTAPQKIHYAYKLEGLEQHWNEVGNVRRASYSNLEPGTYRFLLKASNSDGVWSKKPKALTIHMLPSPWTSIYAKIGYVVLFTALVLLVFRFVLRMKIMQRELDFEHLEREREYAMHQMKLNFFTNISHELRTPLTLIGAPLALVQHDPSVSTASKGHISLISRNVERLYRLLDQLLDFRKLEHEALKLQVRAVVVPMLMQEVQAYFAFHIQQKQIKFTLHHDTNKKTYWIDRDKVEKIMYNLLSNAIKFTPSGHAIDVYIRETTAQAVQKTYPDFSPDIAGNVPSWLEIIVRNEGNGIRQEDLPGLFERFSGADTSTSSAETFGSIGLGLNFTKRMVALHKGSIRATSRLHEWVMLSFVLPADPDAYEPHQVISDSDPFTRDITIAQSEVALYTEKETAHAVQQKKKLVVVEDDPDFADFLQTALSEEYQVLLSENGEQGLTLIHKELPDLVISDVMMSQMSGIELSAQLKKDQEICHIPVILLTAKATINDRIEGLNAGADAYLTKPFMIDHLQAQIHNLLENRAKLHAIFSVGLLPSKDSQQFSELDEKFLHKFEALLTQHIADLEFNIDFIAVEMGFSRSSFYRKFVSLTGNAPHQYIKKFRLRKAAELIKEGKLSLNEISDQVGFSAPSNFSAFFKKEFGVSPKEFK